MKYTINYQDVLFHSSSDQEEAFRRAVEIRTLKRQCGSRSVDAHGVETYVLETPLAQGSLEVEVVTVCEKSGVVTYYRSELQRAC